MTEYSPQREKAVRERKEPERNLNYPIESLPGNRIYEQNQNHDNYNQRRRPSEDHDVYDSDDWLPGAVKCKERKHTKKVGNMKIQSIKRVFTMKDGSVEIVEDKIIERLG